MEPPTTGQEAIGHDESPVHNWRVATRLRDPELGEWVAREVHFPNSMVDRITPPTTDADRAVLADRFGIEDGWPRWSSGRPSRAH